MKEGRTKRRRAHLLRWEFEKNGNNYQGNGKHMKKGTDFKGKGALHLEKRVHKKGALQGTTDTCIMADWATN
jgi:hypothetical protein